jgi:hypothetical protein
LVHIATVHWRSDRWIDVQLRYLKANVDEPYKVYAWLDQELRGRADEFFYATDVPVERHELKLTLLGDLVAHAADPDDVIIFIDGDAFPVAPIMPFLKSKLERYPLVAVRRDENNGDRQPHPSFCATTAGFWRELPGDWRRGYTWLNPQGKEVTDVGGNLLGLLEDAGIEWYPMLRTNKVNPHPLQFGVYEDLVYHHGGGFRLTAGGRLWRASVEDRLNATLRGRLAARLPHKGFAGRVRKMINPVRRYRHALREELAQVNEQVFELIQRDEKFYLQLIEPGRGGELAKIKVPVLLDDDKGLSPTR